MLEQSRKSVGTGWNRLEQVRTSVRTSVGTFVRTPVGTPVRTLVGTPVGTSVGTPVGTVKYAFLKVEQLQAKLKLRQLFQPLKNLS